MSKRNRYRGVAPATLETPERGAEPLDTPEGDEELEKRAKDVEPPAPEPPAAARSEREVRLAAARALKPETTHWASMWMSGRDAALGALEAGTAIAAVYALMPPEGAGCRDCWMRGRDAALRVIQGV